MHFHVDSTVFWSLKLALRAVRGLDAVVRGGGGSEAVPVRRPRARERLAVQGRGRLLRVDAPFNGVLYNPRTI